MGLEDFLRKRGIAPDDAPKIVGSFVGAKYITAIGFLGIGIRFRPIHRVLSPYWQTAKHGEMSRRARLEARDRWIQMQKTFERAKQRNEALGDAQQVAMKRWKEAQQRALRRWKEVEHRWDAEKERRNIDDVPKWIQRQALRRWKKASEKIENSQSPTVRWLALKFRHYSDILAERAVVSRYWSSLVSWTRQDPRRLALGVAEGLILTKLMFPLTGPAELYLIVKFYEWRRRGKRGESDVDLTGISDAIDSD